MMETTGSLLGSQDKGSPIQIFKIEDDHTYSLNVQALAKILLHEKIKDRVISVISIGGAYRKGKSFLLDFMLRYLYSNYVHHNCSNLLGDEDSPLTGFSWRSGSEKETNGIVIWNDVFLVDNKDSKLAVLLMDTQGVFDNQSTVKDCATIFALSLMSSSVFLYNLSNNIQENDLQVLQLFTEYGRLAAEESQESPFQNLTFLLRDWPNPQEHAFGFQGGESFLQKKLMVNPSESQELQSIRKNIKSCFKNINAFLMPHPGFTCSEAENFQGQLKDLRKVFVEQLEVLMPSLLSPHKIQPKVINGKSVMAKEWINYFVSYYQFFSSGAVPEPSSLFNMTVKANSLATIQNAVEEYTVNMSQYDESIHNIEQFDSVHQNMKQQLKQRFIDDPHKLGGNESADPFIQKLDEVIERLYQPLREKVQKELQTKDSVKPSQINFEKIILDLILSIILFIFKL